MRFELKIFQFLKVEFCKELRCDVLTLKGNLLFLFYRLVD